MSSDDIVNLGLTEELIAVRRRYFSQPALLTTNEAAVLYGYSADRYGPLNQLLRDNPTTHLPAFGQHLQKTLAKLPPYQGIVYRGVNLTVNELAKLL